jgi:hypothetical protein
MRNCDDKERREGSHNLEMMACVTGGVKFAKQSIGIGVGV